MKNPLQQLLFLPVILFILSSCQKTVESNTNQSVDAPQKGQFFEYIIRKGQHYANFNAYQSVEYEELNFVVKFDKTAEYRAVDPDNQEDINKLYGFSDNNAEHQQFSARFGWNWARDSLRLYAYVYNHGEIDSKEIISIQPGQAYHCSIKVSGGNYFFSVDNTKVEMHRASTNSRSIGYKLYPYFGGDEAAPHAIHIWIKE